MPTPTIISACRSLIAYMKHEGIRAEIESAT